MNERKKQAQATRTKLIEVGITLFGTQGYSATSAEQIVSAAKVSRGALYHHFDGGKLGLFEAVAAKVLAKLVLSLEQAIAGTKPEWGTIRLMFDTFFEAALTNEYRIIALQDAPSVLGAKRWRELEYSYSVSFIRESLQRLIDEKTIRVVPVEYFSALIFGASCEAALLIAASDNPKKAREKTLDALEQLMCSLRL